MNELLVKVHAALHGLRGTATGRRPASPGRLAWPAPRVGGLERISNHDMNRANKKNLSHTHTLEHCVGYTMWGQTPSLTKKGWPRRWPWNPSWIWSVILHFPEQRFVDPNATAKKEALSPQCTLEIPVFF